MPPARIGLAAGGTAGHIYPALALAAMVRSRDPRAEVLFVGTPVGLESELVSEAGYTIALVPGTPFQRTSSAGRVLALAEFTRGVAESRRVLREFRPTAVIGFGGYASFGALVAARSLGVWTAIHESNVTPGLANRWLGRFVDRIYLTYGESASAFGRNRIRLVGTPVRKGIAALAGHPRTAPALASRPSRVLVLCGSERRDIVNERVPDLLGRVRDAGIEIEVAHQAGSDSAEVVRHRYEKLRMPARVESYVRDLADLYGWADLVIARSGGSTIAEVAATGLPSLLIPLMSAARDHQTRNARLFSRAGAAVWAAENRWDPQKLSESLAALLRDPAAWSRASEAARGLAIPTAAEDVAAECLAA